MQEKSVEQPQESQDQERLQTIYQQDWHSLLDQKISKDQILEIMGEQGMEYKKFIDNGNVLEYLTYKLIGISFCIENSAFNSVFFYNKYDKLMKFYHGSLPYNLNMEKKNGEIVAQLGEPSRVSGGKSIPICLTYEHLGLELTFLTKIWQDSASPIEFVCLFQRDTSEKFKLCGMCKKPTGQKCEKCKLVYYCSRQCQAKHWQVHKQYCCPKKN